jgi:hypothetical protein
MTRASSRPRAAKSVFPPPLWPLPRAGPPLTSPFPLTTPQDSHVCTAPRLAAARAASTTTGRCEAAQMDDVHGEVGSTPFCSDRPMESHASPRTSFLAIKKWLDRNGASAALPGRGEKSASAAASLRLVVDLSSASDFDGAKPADTVGARQKNIAREGETRVRGEVQTARTARTWANDRRRARWERTRAGSTAAAARDYAIELGARQGISHLAGSRWLVHRRSDQLWRA